MRNEDEVRRLGQSFKTSSSIQMSVVVIQNGGPEEIEREE